MFSNCVVVGEEDISKVKAALAKKLHKKGHTQTKISRLLNITQPMVSKYLLQKPSSSEMDAYCDDIVKLVDEGKALSFSLVIADTNLPSGNGYYISTKENLPTEEKQQMVREIHGAISLLEGKDFSSLLPKVKINIAMSTKNASAKKDIASLPSGLVFVNNLLKTYSEPEFGSSSHLSALLLYARILNTNYRSVINVRYSKEILEKINSKKFIHYFLDDDYAIIPQKSDFDILIHKGSFGIEPTTYIFGINAQDAVKKCLTIL